MMINNTLRNKDKTLLHLCIFQLPFRWLRLGPWFWAGTWRTPGPSSFGCCCLRVLRSAVKTSLQWRVSFHHAIWFDLLSLTYWLLERLDILEIFSLEMGQISYDLPKRHFQNDGMSFFALAPRFTTFFLGKENKSKFRESALVFTLFVLLNILFFVFPFFSFSYLFAAVIELLLGLLPVQKFWEIIIETGNF